MIIFKRVKYKNFLSSGNIYIEIELNKHKNTCIVGSNGSGKSTILESIYFALFGKSFRKANKPQLINSINKKDCMVELELTIHGKDYYIKRGLKPNILEFYCNGILLNQDSSSLDYQKYFEDNILRMNSRSFLQIVMLSTMNYVPFMQLPALGRRDIIEDLLDLKIFSKMNILTKEQLQLNKNESSTIENNIKSIQKQIELNNKHIQKLKENNKELIDSKKEYIKSLKEKIKNYKNKKSILETELKRYKNLEKNILKINMEIDQYNKKSLKLKNEISSYNKEIEYYMHTNECSRCRQHIDIDFKNSLILKFENIQKELNIKLNNVEDKMTSCKAIKLKLNEVEKEKNELESEYKELNFSAINLENEMEKYKKDIQLLENKNKNILIEDKIGVSLKDELTSNQNKLKNLIEDKEILIYCLTFLKDDGIKANIIKKYISLINTTINKYLNMLDFFISFELNENFEEVIKSRYRDEQSFENLSEGEKSRINLALLFTWRDIAKIRNTFSTNLLFLDEVFDSSLDALGSEELIKILNNFSDDTNIFVISHRDNMVDKFSNSIYVKKINNFTVIEQ